MLPQRRTAQYVGLVLLALLAAGLSVAALLQNRTVAATRGVPAPASTPTTSASPTLSPLPDASDSPTASPSDSPSAAPSTQPQHRLTKVVVVGDGTSRPVAHGWVERAAADLNWQVTNLSATGMGFTKVATRCTGRCTTFAGAVPAIADANPAVVVVFGGMADGDYPIGPEARAFFAAVRRAEPRAKIVALSPVMTKQGQLGWIRLHRNNIRAAVTAVDGHYVDLGQPSLGSGRLGSKAQEQIARKVISALAKRP